MEITLVNTNEELKEICQQAAKSSIIAIDTEFKRETTYHPKACLIQLATEDLVTCIDPFGIDDFAPLKDILFDPKITKIFHAARQDLEIFHFLFNQLPSPIFDTQIAAALLGLAEQIGYANLAKQMLDVELDKSLTRADWEKRPIPRKQIEYAANDVIYLLKIYHKQIQLLRENHRIHWLDNDFQALLDTKLYVPSPDTAWKKIKNYHRLSLRQRAIAFTVTQWRETVALERDRPRTFIIKNQSILDLANQQPCTLSDLQDIRDIHPSLIRRDGETLLALINEAGNMTEADCPKTKTPTILSAEQSLLLSSLQTLIQIKAKQHHIDSSYLCTKKELEKVIRQDDDAALLKGWKYELAGKDVERFIRGEIKLEVKSGSVQLTEN